MISNFTLIRLIVIISFVLIFPFVQKQWLNLFLFNINSSSFYLILFYLSGIICPAIVSFISINNFTYYDFNCNNNNRRIYGKRLLISVLFTLTSLSFLITNFFNTNLHFFFNTFFDKSFFYNPNLIYKAYLILFISLLLILKNTRVFVKNLILANFSFMSLIIWHVQFNNLLDNDKLIFINNSYLEYNYINVLFLLTIEIIYYIWSLLSYKNNLSDWSVTIPLKSNFLSISKIIIFYSFIFVYYSILE